MTRLPAALVAGPGAPGHSPPLSPPGRGPGRHPGRQEPPGGHAHRQRQDPDLQFAGAGEPLQNPRGHALYLFPLKALEQDQLKALKELDAALPSPFLSAAIYDGDTPPVPAPGHQGQAAPRAHQQPGHAAPGAYAVSRLLVRLFWRPQVRGHRRSAHLPGHHGQPHGPGAAAPEAHLRLLRLPARNLSCPRPPSPSPSLSSGI